MSDVTKHSCWVNWKEVDARCNLEENLQDERVGEGDIYIAVLNDQRS